MSEQERTVLPIMLGTAGHIDHGKTSLVKALTAWDTDTHKEEKERGVTIDFGVAPFQVNETQICGFIDVPGHIDYIRNMVAGASAIDLLILVVAADDGVMPQTREHMEIASLLGVTRVISVLTKSDLVDAETLELASIDVSEFLEKLGYSDVPQFTVSSQTGEGIAELRERLLVEVQSSESTSSDKPFRMFVRRAFTMKGFGTVVTGVPISGSVNVGDNLELMPGEVSYGIRAIQNYRSEVNTAKTHISCAINLRDVSPDVFQRGMALVCPGKFESQRNILIACNNVSELDIEPRKKGQIIRLHVGTAAVAARVSGTVRAGGSGFLQLNAYKPLVVTPGDRVLLRTLSTSITLGGGVVLASCPDTKAELLSPERNLLCSEAMQEGNMLKACFYSAERAIFSAKYAANYCQEPLVDVEKKIKKLCNKNELIALGDGLYMVPSRIDEFLEKAVAVLKRYHRGNPNSFGMRDQHFCEVLGLPKSCFGRLWQHLQKAGVLAFENSFVSLKEFKPNISKQDAALQEKLLTFLNSATGGSIARGNVQDELGVTDKEFRKIVKRLIDSEQVAAVGGSLILLEKLGEIESQMIALFKTENVLELKKFRDTLGLSRNAAVEILEYFDSRGLTKRQGSGRVLAQKIK